MGERGLKPSHHNPTRQCYRLPPEALVTTEALHNDLERLDDECRERSQAHNQSRSQPRSHLRNLSRDQTQGHSQSPPCTNSQDVHSPLPDGQPNRRVNFCKPGDKCSVVEGENPSVEPSVSNLEAWLEYQSTQIGTPMWWKELEALLGSLTGGNLPGRSRCCFIYWKCSPGCSQEKGILHLLPPKV